MNLILFGRLILKICNWHSVCVYYQYNWQSSCLNDQGDVLGRLQEKWSDGENVSWLLKCWTKKTTPNFH
jgi:hypothetical protein